MIEILLAFALAQEGVYSDPPPPAAPAPVVFIIAEPVAAGNDFPRPAHDPLLNGGCNEWDDDHDPLVEHATDGTPCVYVIP